MRSLLLINPNATAAMTEQMAKAAARWLPEDVGVEARTAAFGFPVIASRASYAVAALAVLDAYERRGVAHDAVVIACFGDPGLEALREAAKEPVFGMAESSVREADALGEPFAIVTMGPAWVEILNERVALASLKSPFVGVFAAEGTGLDVRDREAAVFAELERLADEAVAAGASTLILGGGIFAGRKQRLKTDAQVIDCMEATMRAALAAKKAAYTPNSSNNAVELSEPTRE